MDERKRRWGYTPDPVRGEPRRVTAARIITWLLAQLSPEQRSAFLSEETGDQLPPFDMIHTDLSWRRGITRLLDTEDEVRVGIRFSHPLVNADSFTWNGLTVHPTYVEEDHVLDLKVVNQIDRRRLLRINIQNIYQDEETETIAQIRVIALGEAEGPLPLPRLIEGVPSIFLSLKEYRG